MDGIIHDDDTTRADRRTHVPASIVQQGTTLSQALLAELVELVQTTAARERARIRVTWVLGSAAALLGPASAWFVRAPTFELTICFAAVALAVPALLHLIWGVVNRALLDASAVEAAVGPDVLPAAVAQMKRGADAEEAVYDALYGPRRAA
jgi:hypothetical protein